MTAPQLALQAPDVVGNYRIVGLLGRGRTGAVYRGARQDGDFQHVVAIKVLSGGLVPHAEAEALRRERQILADLSHPYIAQLYDGGQTQEGAPFLIMEMVEGVDLPTWLRQQRPPRVRRLKLFVQICEAVAFAHRALVIHGDLKPSKILVTGEDEAKLIGFGARPLVAETRRPASSLYAAPEQQGGEAASTLVDVYALGKILELVAGAEPPDRELQAIVARATAADPAQRYTSVELLAQDVVARLTSRPVTAVNGGRAYHAAKFISRHKWPTASAGAAASLLVAAFVVSLLANHKAQAERANAEARFQQVRSLAKTMMFDGYDAVAELPGSLNARLLLAKTSQTYLDSLAADATAPIDVQREAGEGYYRLARVTGFSGGGSLGQRQDGVALFEKSAAILEDLYRREPDRADIRLALGHELAVMAGESLYADGDSKTARQRAQRAIQLLTNLEPQTVRSAGALAGAYLYLGDSYGWDNDIPGAGKVYEKGIALVQAMPASLRDSPEVGVSMSGLLRQSGEVYRYTDQPQLAVERMRMAEALNRKIVIQQNRSPSAVRKLVASMWSLADLYRVTGQLGEALNTISEAQAISRDQAIKNPSDAGWPESIALTGIVLAQVQSARGAHAKAVQAADEAIAIRKDLARRSGDNKGSRLAVAVGLKDVSDVYRAAGDEAKACASLANSHAIMAPYQAEGSLSQYDKDNNLEPVLSALKACQDA